MDEIKTSRPFEQRFLDGYERSQLREDVQKAPRRLSGMRRKYATWALGATLALGGLGVPMKIIQTAQSQPVAGNVRPPTQPPVPAVDAEGIQSDLRQAASIASDVAGGVASGVTAAADGVKSAASLPLPAVEEAPHALTAITESIRQQFFSSQVPFGSLIYSEAKKNDLSPELVAAVVNTESRFNPNARSQAGAIGLMQLVPRTGRWMGAHDLTNPSQNISAGAKYLRYLSDRFGGDQQKVIAAYNAGEGNVRRFRGVPPFQETRSYVNRVNSFRQDLGDRVAGHVQERIASTE